MKIIKFRGKQINIDEWVYGHLFYGKNEQGQDEAFIVSLDYYCRDGLIDLNTCASWQVDIETVGQYTGLKDKNGKEIYEGDIVKALISGRWFVGKVVYEHSGFTIDVTSNKELEFGRRGIIEHWTEIIGNVFDNPDLLKEE